MTMTATWKPGLEGVVAARTALSHVDGEAGELIVRGYRVDDLAPNATFEEVAGLLWGGELPDGAELARLARGLRPDLAALRPALEAATASRDDDPMDALRRGIGTLRESGGAQADAERLVAAGPAVVAA